MTVEYIKTELTDEGSIRWYEVDEVEFGVMDGKLMDYDGVLITEKVYARAILRMIEKYEAAK